MRGGSRAPAARNSGGWVDGVLNVKRSMSFGKAEQTLAASTIGLTFGYSTIGATCFGVFVLPLSDAFGWGRGDISVASTIMSYTVAALTPFAGVLADRYGARRVLLPSMVAFGLGLAAVTLISGDIRQLYVAYFLLALAGLGITPVIYSRAIVQWFDKHRGFALGVGLTGVGIGTATIPLIVQAAVGRFGWQGGYLSMSLLVLAFVFPLCWLWIHSPAYVRAGTEIRPAEGHTLREATRTRTYWQLLVGFALLTVFPLATLSHLIPLLQDRGSSPETAALAASALGAALIVGRLVTGALLDRFFAPYVVIACMGAAALGLGMLAAGGGEGWAFAAVALIGLGVGAEVDFMAYLVSRYHGRRAYARIVGTVYAAMGLGQGVGPVLMGYGYQTYGNYQLALMIVCGLTVLGTIPLATLGRYPRFAEPPAPDDPLEVSPL